MNSPVSPVEILTVLLIELLFSIGYDHLAAWAQGNRIWHTSISVVIGVAVTLAIPTAWWWPRDLAFWQAVSLLTACFAASGLPMIVGSARRTVRESHKPHAWPTKARQAREDAVMELSALAHEIAGETRENRLTVQHLPDYVNRLHQVIGTLKSV